MRCKWLLLFVFISFQQLWAQDSLKTWYQDHRGKFNLSAGIDFKNNSLIFVAEDRNYFTLTTNNRRPSYALRFTYHWLNLRLSAPLWGLSYSDPLKGETDNYAMAVGYTGEQLWVRSFVEYYKGFYLADPAKMDPQWFDKNLAYPLRPDISSLTIFGNVYYGFNRHYSHRALLWQSEEQLKSAGSWLMGTTLSYDLMKGDSAFAGNNWSAFQSTNIGTWNNSQHWSIAFAVGYAHTFVLIPDLSITLMAAPGIAISEGKTKSENGNLSGWSTTLGSNSEFRALLAYSRKNWFYSIGAQAYIIVKEYDQYEYGLNYIRSVRFNVGYRFPLKSIPGMQGIGL